MILFGVLVACAFAGIYCAIHFGSARGVERALITLRERPDDPQPKYLSVLIPPETNGVSTKTEPGGTRSTPLPTPPSKLHDARRQKEGPTRTAGKSNTINRSSSGLPDERPDFGRGIASEPLPATASLLISGSTIPSTFSAGAIAFEEVELPTEVPEPATTAFLLGGTGLAFAFRRRSAR